MSASDIVMEIHSPGINLHSNRWSLHRMFLEEIEAIYESVAAEAWKHYKEDGRGTLLVDQKRWMEVLRHEWKNGFPARYLSATMSLKEMGLERLRTGFLEILVDYDPERELVLSVHHHPGEMISCYLFSGDPTPRACYERLVG